MLLLDLDSTDREQYTRTKSYMGQPFIFNMIHTFGGQMALFGRNHRINTRPFQARQMNNSTLVGRLTIINSRWKKIAQQLRLIIPLKTVYHKAFQPLYFTGTGFAPEGIHNSYVAFDLMSEMSWRHEPISNLNYWFQKYADRRYVML